MLYNQSLEKEYSKMDEITKHDRRGNETRCWNEARQERDEMQNIRLEMTQDKTWVKQTVKTENTRRNERQEEMRWDCDKGVMPDFSFPLWCPGDPSLSSDFSDSASNHFPAPAEPPRDDSFHHIHHKDTWEGLSPCGATVHLPEDKYIGKEGFTARTNRWGG